MQELLKVLLNAGTEQLVLFVALAAIGLGGFGLYLGLVILRGRRR